ncbi:MAG TPA: hypothetical protein VFY67_14880 [Pyrinomonadaceae bacterium]|nr:hypothetical protein [Pyrinomonadaceae bacterium]
MKAKLSLTVLILLASTTAFGQTVSDIESGFGQPVKVYSVSEHIWMTPEYTRDGQVCQMRFFPKRIGPDTNYLSGPLPFHELKSILNRLLPPSTRGAKADLFGYTDTGGGIAWTTYPYEKATFVFIFPLRVTAEAVKQAQSVSFSAEEILAYRKQPKMPPSANDFDNSEGSKLEIVTIKWNGRQCADR